MFDKAKSIATSRMGGSSSSSKSKSSSSSGSNKQQAGSEKDVLILDDKNFNDVVYAEDSGMFVVAFYAPWCVSEYIYINYYFTFIRVIVNNFFLNGFRQLLDSKDKSN